METIAEQFDITLASLHVSNKISDFITYNAFSMIKAFSLPGFKYMEELSKRFNF